VATGAHLQIVVGERERRECGSGGREDGGDRGGVGGLQAVAGEVEVVQVAGGEARDGRRKRGRAVPAQRVVRDVEVRQPRRREAVADGCDALALHAWGAAGGRDRSALHACACARPLVLHACAGVHAGCCCSARPVARGWRTTAQLLQLARAERPCDVAPGGRCPADPGATASAEP
jgi:hypothetical protein